MAIRASAAAGPLAIAVLRVILPYDTTDDAAATAAKVAAAPAVESAVLWLTYLALLTLLLGVLITNRQAMRAPGRWRPIASQPERRPRDRQVRCPTSSTSRC